jgi:hypothetical protein
VAECEVLESRVTKHHLDWFAARLLVAVYDTNAEFRMTTIADQLKAARAKMAEARESAAKAVAETADASDLVRREVERVLKEAADLRAEVAGLTNGGPVLEEPAIVPAVNFVTTAVDANPAGELSRVSANGQNVPGVTTY